MAVVAVAAAAAVAVIAVPLSPALCFPPEDALRKHSLQTLTPRTVAVAVSDLTPGSNAGAIVGGLSARACAERWPALTELPSLSPTSSSTPDTATVTMPRTRGSGPPKDTRGEDSGVSTWAEAFPEVNFLSSNDFLSSSSLRTASSNLTLGRTKHVAPPPEGADTSEQHLLLIGGGGCYGGGGGGGI